MMNYYQSMFSTWNRIVQKRSQREFTDVKFETISGMGFLLGQNLATVGLLFWGDDLPVGVLVALFGLPYIFYLGLFYYKPDLYVYLISSEYSNNKTIFWSYLVVSSIVFFIALI